MVTVYLFIIGGMAAGFSILIIWLILAYLRPAMTSPGWFFIAAKKNNLPVAVVEDGGHWRFILGRDTYNGEGYIVDKKTDDVVIVAPNALKYGRGVLMGVGESFKSILIHPSYIKVIGAALKNDWSPKDIRTAVEKIEMAISSKEGKDKEDKGGDN